MSLAIFIPVRKGSERVLEKNTRKFSDYKNGLLERKLDQLKDFKIVDEIILSTNDESSLEIASTFKAELSNLRIDHRPDHLGRTDTNLIDLIQYVPNISNCDHFLWTHVTSPFCTKENYEQAIIKYREQSEFDSLMTGSLFQEFLWNNDKKSILNNSSNQFWPRSQDLEKNFLIDNAIFIAPRESYEKGNRVGLNPYLMELDKITSWDIDTETDFKLAELIYEGFFK